MPGDPFDTVGIGPFAFRWEKRLLDELRRERERSDLGTEPGVPREREPGAVPGPPGDGPVRLADLFPGESDPIPDSGDFERYGDRSHLRIVTVNDPPGLVTMTFTVEVDDVARDMAERQLLRIVPLSGADPSLVRVSDGTAAWRGSGPFRLLPIPLRAVGGTTYHSVDGKTPSGTRAASGRQATELRRTVVEPFGLTTALYVEDQDVRLAIQSDVGDPPVVLVLVGHGAGRDVEYAVPLMWRPMDRIWRGEVVIGRASESLEVSVADGRVTGDPRAHAAALERAADAAADPGTRQAALVLLGRA